MILCEQLLIDFYTRFWVICTRYELFCSFLLWDQNQGISLMPAKNPCKGMCRLLAYFFLIVCIFFITFYYILVVTYFFYDGFRVVDRIIWVRTTSQEEICISIQVLWITRACPEGIRLRNQDLPYIYVCCMGRRLFSLESYLWIFVCLSLTL